MSSQALSLFRRSWLSLMLAMLGMVGCIGLIGLTQIGSTYTTHTEAMAFFTTSFNWFRWIEGQLVNWLSGMLAALVLPWLTLHLAGEWFYTRPLPRRELFQVIWREFLRWWGPLFAGLLAVIWLSNSFYRTSGAELSWEMAGFLGSSSLFGGLLLAAPPRILSRLALPFAGLVGWFFLADDLQLGGQPVGHAVSWAGWLGLFAWSYVQVSRQADEPSLNGSGDDEAHFFSRLSLPWPTGKISLRRPRRGRAWMDRLRLMTTYTGRIYLQLMLICAGLSAAVTMLLHQPGNTNVEATGLGAFLLLSAGTLLLINPRYLLSRRWELLASRPLSPLEAYTANWSLQGLLLLLPALGGLLLAQSLMPGVSLQLTHLAQLLLWLWLGGEIAIALLLLLVVLSLTVSPSLVAAELILLHANDWPAWILMALAAGFRCWDAFQFQRDWSPAPTPRLAFQRVAGHLVPSLGLMLAASWGMMLSQPLTAFMVMPNPERLQEELQSQLRLASFIQLYRISSPEEFRRAEAEDRTQFRRVVSGQLISELLQQPRNPKLALQMAQQIAIDSTLDDFDQLRLSPADAYLPVLRTAALAAAEPWIRAGKGADEPARLALEAQRLMSAGEPAAAMATLKQAIALSPQADYRLLHARMLAETVKVRQATQELKQMGREWAQQGRAGADQAWMLAAYRLEIDTDLAGAAVAAGEVLSLPGELHDQALSLLARLDLPGHGRCDLLGQQMSRMQEWKISPKQLETLSRQQALCDNPPASAPDSLDKAGWYLRHHQPATALAVLNRSEKPSGLNRVHALRAEILQALGQTAAASREAAVVDHNLTHFWMWDVEPPTYLRELYHRSEWVLIQTAPTVEIAHRLLLTAADTAEVWPLVEKAFAGQGAQLQALKRFRNALDSLYAAYAAADAPGPVGHSPLFVRVMLEQRRHLPAHLQTPALEAAAQKLIQELKPPQ